MTAHAITYDTAHPGDTSRLRASLERFSVSGIRRMALVVKTEGNADANDYSREYALSAAQRAIAAYGGDALVERTSFLFSTGCEGILSPFGYLFVDVDDEGLAPSPAGRALVFGGARSRPILPSEIGTVAHAELVAETVETAMADLGIGPSDVGLVIVKTPLISLVPGATPVTSRLTSAFSKAVGALGAGLALGEVAHDDIVASSMDHNLALHARRAMVFSSSQGGDVEVLIFANRAGACGNLIIHTGSFADMLDAGAIRQTLRAAGCIFDEDGVVSNPETIAASFVKAGIASNGMLRQFRTTIRTSHIDMDKHVRAAMSGMVGGMLGTCQMFLSANTVHQAPDGGGLCAFIVKAA